MDDPVTISGLRFYGKIIRKYQRGKRNSFRFPMMIFLKNTGQAISRKINVNIRILLHYNDRSIASALIGGSVQNIKRMFSWFGIEKFFPVDSMTFSGVFSQHGNMGTALYKIHRALIFTPSALHRVEHPLQGPAGDLKKAGRAEVMIKRSTGPGISRSYSFSGKEHTCEYKFMLEHEIPAVISHVNMFLNNRIFSGITLYSQEVRKVHLPVKKNMQFAVNYTTVTDPVYLYAFEHRLGAAPENFLQVNMRLPNAVFYPFETHNISSAGMAAGRHGIFINFAPVVNPGYFSVSRHTSHAAFPHRTSPPDRFPGSTVYLQKVLNVPPDQEKANRLSGIHDGYAGIMYHGYGFAFEPGFRSARSQVSSLQKIILTLSKDGGRIDRIRREPVTFLKPLIKQVNLKFDPDAAGFTQLKRKNPFKDDSNLHFRHDGKIEQEIEQIKKTTEEVKRTVIEKTLPEDISRVADVRGRIDIGQLSDEVYQIIDRRIKIEKERRGYI